jgi:hypothetical protein
MEADMIIEPKFSDSSAEARAAYARQAALYASQVRDVRPADDPFEQPGTTLHEAIEARLAGDE